jgi:hypothetical protein
MYPHASADEVVMALESVGTCLKVRTVEFVRQILHTHEMGTVPTYIYQEVENGETP